MWDLPGPEIEPMSLALQEGLLTTGPPGKAPYSFTYLFACLQATQLVGS